MRWDGLNKSARTCSTSSDDSGVSMALARSTRIRTSSEACFKEKAVGILDRDTACEPVGGQLDLQQHEGVHQNDQIAADRERCSEPRTSSLIYPIG
jgi:hypothetical protein